MNKISFKIIREMLMELASLKKEEDVVEYIEDCFAIDKSRIENVQTIHETSLEPVLSITIKPKNDR